MYNESVLKTLEPFEVYVLPGWIHRALIRNNVTIAEINDYAKVKPSLSNEDLAEWISLNDRFKIQGSVLSNSFLDMFFKTENSENKLELKHIVDYSFSEEVFNSASSRLNTFNPMNAQASQLKLYEFIMVSNTLYVVLNEGFNTITKDPSALQGFTRNYLKQCYSMTSVDAVSRLAMFDVYLKQLANA